MVIARTLMCYFQTGLGSLDYDGSDRIHCRIHRLSTSSTHWRHFRFQMESRVAVHRGKQLPVQWSLYKCTVHPYRIFTVLLCDRFGHTTIYTDRVTDNATILMFRAYTGLCYLWRGLYTLKSYTMIFPVGWQAVNCLGVRSRLQYALHCYSCRAGGGTCFYMIPAVLKMQCLFFVNCSFESQYQ